MAKFVQPLRILIFFPFYFGQQRRRTECKMKALITGYWGLFWVSVLGAQGIEQSSHW